MRDYPAPYVLALCAAANLIAWARALLIIMQ
jgi:hypothetical protein